MIAFHLLRFFLHVIQGAMICALVFPLCDGAGRLRHIQRWSRQLLAICGVEVELQDGHDGPLGQHAMIVSNHVSWLDIFVINTIYPCRFVAKAEIRDWPVFGWMSVQVGTVFISRGNRRDVRKIFKDMVSSLHAGDRVAFFPEGATALQGELLPFHANLFEAAIDAAVPVQPYALRYVDAAGQYHPAVDYVGDTSALQSMVAVLRSGKITAQLLRLPLIDTTGVQRRSLAQASRQAMRQALDIKTALSPVPDIADNPPEITPDH